MTAQTPPKPPAVRARSCETSADCAAGAAAWTVSLASWAEGIFSAMWETASAGEEAGEEEDEEDMAAVSCGGM